MGSSLKSYPEKCTGISKKQTEGHGTSQKVTNKTSTKEHGHILKENNAVQSVKDSRSLTWANYRGAYHCQDYHQNRH